MSEENPARRYTVIIAILATGFSIGWLAGMSVSPIVATITASVTAAAAAIVSALSGIDDKSASVSDAAKTRLRVDPVPLGFLAFGIVIGSVMGVTARNNHWMGSGISSEIAMWSSQGIDKEDVLVRLYAQQFPFSPYTQTYSDTLNAEINMWTSLGLGQAHVVQRIFEQRYPENQAQNTPSDPDTQGLGTFLFAVDARECARLIGAAKAAKTLSDAALLITELESSPDQRLSKIPEIVGTEAAILLVEQVLCSEN